MQKMIVQVASIAFLWGSLSVTAQQTVDNNETFEEKGRSATSGSITNRADARTMLLTIPAPRGMITDRDGKPLAQSRVRYELALNFPQLIDESDASVLKWARTRLARAATISDKVRDFSDKALLSHYEHRRWIPLAISSDMSPKAAAKLDAQLSDGLEKQALYTRYYPEKKVAAHIIGHVRSDGRLPTGPINFGDPLWETTTGKEGLEAIFDEQLKGVNGQRRMLFDSDGTKLLDEIVRAPKAGKTVVTTLDLTWQKLAEQVLSDGADRGAFVVLDIQTGEVMAMASEPSYDLNVYIPRISTEDYTKLRDDESSPLFNRAYQAAYPPASAFKPIVALEALNNEVVYENTTIHCPAKVKIGVNWFRNWSEIPEGHISVKRAIARSNNPWFYKVGIDTGADEFLALARRLGYGKKTGLPLMSETEGVVPTDEWMTRVHGRHITHGDTAQLAIGQGVMLASPLQVAQGMAGIANGKVLPRLHLIRQLQDLSGRVVMAARPDVTADLKVSQKAVKIVHQGMNDEPRYAFAVVYEGKPFETLSGGKKAAPIVRRFFNNLRGDVENSIKPPPVAETISEEDLLKELGLSPEEPEIEEDLPEAIIAEPVDEEAIIAELVNEEALLAEPVTEDEPEAGSNEEPDPIQAEPVDPGQE